MKRIFIFEHNYSENFLGGSEDVRPNALMSIYYPGASLERPDCSGKLHEFVWLEDRKVLQWKLCVRWVCEGRLVKCCL